MPSQWFQVPQMTSRRCVREVSAWISDVPGVRAVEARLDTATVHVTGTADPAAIAAEILVVATPAAGTSGSYATSAVPASGSRSPPCRPPHSACW